MAFASSKLAREAGWFSRRHQTSEAHDEARERRAEKRRQRYERIEQERAQTASMSLEDRIARAEKSPYNRSKEIARLKEKLGR